MENFKGTQGIITANGLHIRCEGKNGSIGQAYLMNFKHDIRGSSIPDEEGEANAKLWAASYELLETCMDVLFFFEYEDEHPNHKEIIKTMRGGVIAELTSAINKAIK